MQSEQMQLFLNSDDIKTDSDVIELKSKLSYTINAMTLINKITNSLPIIENLLFSKTTSDILEALQFATRAVNFNLKGSTQTLQK